MMAGTWLERVTGPLEQNREYRRIRARVDALPEQYLAVAGAFDRYLTYYGGITDADTIVRMLGDLADLWERAAVDGTPVREIVGEDPVDFAETFAQAYGGSRWIDKERARLTRSIDDAEQAGVGRPSGPR